MYNVNDTVLYGSLGIFRIAEIAQKNFNGKNTEYYVLKPVCDDRSTIFVPAGNEASTAKMHKILSKEEIYKIIKAIPDENPVWIENEVMRNEKYKEIMASGDRTELIKLIKTLYLYQQRQKANGKKLRKTDEQIMKNAEKLLYDEFAHVLNIEREQVLPFIIEQIQVNEHNCG